MRDMSDPNDHNYVRPNQDESSTAMKEDGDGIGPLAGDYSHAIPNLVDYTIDLAWNSVRLWSVHSIWH
jgi:hypothetical protein